MGNLNLGYPIRRLAWPAHRACIKKTPGDSCKPFSEKTGTSTKPQCMWNPVLRAVAKVVIPPSPP